MNISKILENCMGIENADIEKVFKNCNWEKKLEVPCPDYDVTEVFRIGDGEKLQKYLEAHAENTSEVTRTLFLFNDSIGSGVAVIEQPWTT
ncbi:MAG: hypothetical protein VR67_17675 [Peptococcaceae bacterium BRH_c8a]|nr:MAG: hypothetical protein VR67_17675 [Peptococcaceae bacterium BRH_c8a]